MFRPKPGLSNPTFKYDCHGHSLVPAMCAWSQEGTQVPALAFLDLPQSWGLLWASRSLQSRTGTLPTLSLCLAIASWWHVVVQPTAVALVTFNNPIRKTLLIVHFSVFCSPTWPSFLCPWGFLSLPPVTHFPKGTAALSSPSLLSSHAYLDWATGAGHLVRAVTGIKL